MDFLSLLVSGFPIVSTVMRWWLERGMKVEIEPHGITPYSVGGGEYAFVEASFNLTLRNHSATKKVRVSKGVVVIRKRRLLLWHRDIGREIPIPELSEVSLEPLSPAWVQQITVNGSGAPNLPQKSELVLRLYLVGLGHGQQLNRTLIRIRCLPRPRPLAKDMIDCEGQ